MRKLGDKIALVVLALNGSSDEDLSALQAELERSIGPKWRVEKISVLDDARRCRA